MFADTEKPVKHLSSVDDQRVIIPGFLWDVRNTLTEVSRAVSAGCRLLRLAWFCACVQGLLW